MDVQDKLKFLAEAEGLRHLALREFLRRWGISRETYYRWRRRYKAQGPSALGDRRKDAPAARREVAGALRRAIAAYHHAADELRAETARVRLLLVELDTEEEFDPR